MVYLNLRHFLRPVFFFLFVQPSACSSGRKKCRRPKKCHFALLFRRVHKIMCKPEEWQKIVKRRVCCSFRLSLTGDALQQLVIVRVQFQPAHHLGCVACVAIKYGRMVWPRPMSKFKLCFFLKHSRSARAFSLWSKREREVGENMKIREGNKRKQLKWEREAGKGGNRKKKIIIESVRCEAVPSSFNRLRVARSMGIALRSLYGESSLYCTERTNAKVVCVC